MRRQSSQRGYRSLSGVLIALAAVVCAGASRAEAACSHYVLVGKDARAASLQLEILSRNSSALSTHQTAGVPARPKPCSGALCSGKPAVPVPIPAASGTTRVDQWGELMPPPPRLPLEVGIAPDRDCFVRALVEGPTLERPPR